MFLQIIINSIIAGSLYALIASGFSLIYYTNRFVHFAHGAVIMLGGYFLFLFFSLFGFNFWIAVIFSLVLTSLTGFLLNFFIYQNLRLRGASNVILLISSIAILIFIESFISIFFGAGVQTIDYLTIGKGIEFGSAIITSIQIVIFFVSLFLLISLFLFMKKTKIGKAMRAVADNREVAEIIGISAKKVYSWSFVLGSFIAGIAGILIGLEQNLEPTMGTSLMIKGFTSAIIGGLGSVSGAIFGSFILGAAENFGVWFLPSGFKDAIAFILLFIFLLIRPQGILGIKKIDD